MYGDIWYHRRVILYLAIYQFYFISSRVWYRIKQTTTVFIFYACFLWGSDFSMLSYLSNGYGVSITDPCILTTMIRQEPSFGYFLRKSNSGRPCDIPALVYQWATDAQDMQDALFSNSECKEVTKFSKILINDIIIFFSDLRSNIIRSFPTKMHSNDTFSLFQYN